MHFVVDRYLLFFYNLIMSIEAMSSSGPTTQTPSLVTCTARVR
jgi:hypothetical protein